MENSTNSVEQEQNTPPAPVYKANTEHEVPLRAPSLGLCLRLQNAWVDAAVDGMISAEHNLSLKAAFVAACFPSAPSERTNVWERIARDLPDYYQFPDARRYGDAALEVFAAHRVDVWSLLDIGSAALDIITKRIPTKPRMEELAAPFVALRVTGPA